MNKSNIENNKSKFRLSPIEQEAGSVVDLAKPSSIRSVGQPVIIDKQVYIKQNGKSPVQPVAENVEAAKAKTHKTGLFIVAAISILLALVAGGQAWQFFSTHESTDDAYVSGHIHQVSSRVTGTVAEVLIDDNQYVKAGQTIVKLDPTDYLVKVQQAQSALELARRQAEVAKSNVGQTDQDAIAQSTQASGSLNDSGAAIAAAQDNVQQAKLRIPQSEADLAKAQATLEDAQADYKRYVVLEQQGAISKQQLDAATAAYKVAQAQKSYSENSVSQAKSQLSEAEQGVLRAQASLLTSKGKVQEAASRHLQVDIKQRQYDAAMAQVEQAQADLKDAQNQLSYCNIIAPADGRIAHKGVEVGQRLQPGQTLLAVVDQQTWIFANFKETQLERMQPGQKVEITVDTFPHHKFIGQVDSLQSGSGAEFALLPSDNATGNFTKIVQRIPVKVVFDAKSIAGYQSRIYPGMSAVVTVSLKG